jgi:tetratricopeptide (TPR) repeat protein
MLLSLIALIVHSEAAIADEQQDQKIKQLCKEAAQLGDGKNYEQALSVCKQALTIDNDNLNANKLMALLLIKLKKYSEALPHIEKAIEHTPPGDKAEIQLRFDRGVALGNLKEADKSLADLNFVVEKDPTYAPAFEARAAAYLACGKFEAALSDLNHYMELCAEQHEVISPAVYGGRGEAYRGLGQYEKAIQDLSYAIERDEMPDDYLLSRAMCYEALGQKRLASEDRRKAKRLEHTGKL